MLSKSSLTPKQEDDLKKAQIALKKLNAQPIKLDYEKQVNNLQLQIDKMDELWDFYEMYTSKMEELHYIDFNDMINKVLEKFENTESDLLEMVASKYKYIIVDEYQDTNTAQNDIVFNLAKYCPNVFVVGDDWAGKYDYLKEQGVDVVYFPYGSGVSSTSLKQRIYERYEKLQNEANNHLPADADTGGREEQ